MLEKQTSIARIAKVNHAGEYGAIRIYGAQISVSKILWKPLVASLTELQSHEIQHCDAFLDAMKTRNERPCRIMPLWSVGGWVLGFVTALLDPKSIWACTEAVEETVHDHLGDQLHYLKDRDAELFGLIKSIQEEEEGHLTLAIDNKGSDSLYTRILYQVVKHSVDAAIWMSTWGESTQMRRDLKEAA